MAVFNFDLKRQSYELAIRQTQQALAQGDMQTGGYYLSVAIDVCTQLVNNAAISQLREKYVMEHAKLLQLQRSLEGGVNPFASRAHAVSNGSPSDDGARNPGGGAPSGGSSSGAAQGGGKKLTFFQSKSPTVRLADVAGLTDVKKQIRLRVIAPMRDPDLYRKYMDEAGCQILMYGPPGCGKSFVAEAIAGELECAYALVNAPDLMDKYVGEGPKKVVQLFKESEQFDNCLIFLDELDSVFSSRESDDSRYTKDILTTLLTCMSGFHADKGNGVKILIGATNRPWALDSALIRGKRFDTHIYVGLPDEEARAFLVHKAFKKHPSLIENTDITEGELTAMLEGYSCADITSMLEKMKTMAFERALDDKGRGIDSNEPITRADATSVKANYRNSVTPESLQAFEAFKNGEI